MGFLKGIEPCEWPCKHANRCTKHLESSQDLEAKIVSWRNEIDIRQKELDEQRQALEIERPLLNNTFAKPYKLSAETPYNLLRNQK